MSDKELQVKELWVKDSTYDFKQWEQLLLASDLKPGEPVDSVYGWFDGDQLVASGALFENIIKYLAIEPMYQGGSTFHQLLTTLTQALYRQGETKVFVYTKPEHRQRFEALNFTVIAQTTAVCFLEKGTPTLSDYLATIPVKTAQGTAGAIVMNANPLTWGHRYLVEQASRLCDQLYLFVVSTDRSLFTTAERIALVKNGVSDLANVSVYESGDYMVSTKTFPSYFLKGNQDKVAVQAQLDATLFAEKIAPALHITQRFVGSEPYSNTTACYNQQLKATMNGKVRVNEIPRKSSSDGQPISASRVRTAILQEDWALVTRLVPQSTADYIWSHRQSLRQRQQEMKAENG
ncbi:MAG: [citrate (pro-3S)-lyase] ligase [Aerococcus sp.]|nr:[citrate (pro-3S)-lyase] ligase [Aerococcus sp.]